MDKQTKAVREGDSRVRTLQAGGRAGTEGLERFGMPPCPGSRRTPWRHSGEAAIAHGQCRNNAVTQSQRDGATARRFAVAATVEGPIGRKFGTGVRPPEALLNVSPLNAAMAVKIVTGNSVGDPLVADGLH